MWVACPTARRHPYLAHQLDKHWFSVDMLNGNCIVVTQSLRYHKQNSTRANCIDMHLFNGEHNFRVPYHLLNCNSFAVCPRIWIDPTAFIFVIITNFTNLRNMLSHLFRNISDKIDTYKPLQLRPTIPVQCATTILLLLVTSANWKTFL